MIPSSVFDLVLHRFLSPVKRYLDDASVTEVLINGPGKVYVERAGRLEKVPAKFSSAEHVVSALRVVAQYSGRAFDAMHPILEARLPDGSRLEALLEPLVADGPSVSIRRFPNAPLTMDRLLQGGSLSGDAAAFLLVLVESKCNVVVAGGTGSGKTSLLNALSALIPAEERVIVIEDSRELQLQRDHVVQLQSRPADAKGRGCISIRDLFKASLRMRPDRLVLGEIRGGEALDLVQAMTSGHGGCLTTVHATHPRDTLHRLETMALMAGVDMPLHALRAQVASAVDIIVQTARHRDGRRGVTHISEVCSVEGDRGYVIQDLYALDQNAGGGLGTLAPTGVVPQCLDAIRAHGLSVPDAMQSAFSQRRSTSGEARSYVHS